jgi:hypothetical protein
LYRDAEVTAVSARHVGEQQFVFAVYWACSKRRLGAAPRDRQILETSVFHRISQKQTLETTVGRAPASEHLPNFKL